MKLLLPNPNSRRAQGGWALIIVLVLAVGSLLVVGSVLHWSNVTGNVTARNNEFYATTYAAEGATEKVLAAIVSDYENYGEPIVYSRLATYSNSIPNSSDDPYWANYTFTAGPGQSNLTVINRINPTNIIILGPPYQGLYMLAATYEIIATAINNSSGLHISAAVGQAVNLGTIPIFQFAIFFQNTMEVDPGANMTINGFVHG
ncbi:MAG TPA: hypothetical protein VN765_07180, partial [Candidatus Acidoferrum sp.]|nr:hypothetical protein [Candidatus Acidoferrum sp.]